MDSNIFSALIDFRKGLYACFLRAGDVLMNTADALLSHTEAHSLVELSLSPYFERRWSSLYDAFENAKIDRSALRTLLMSALPTLPEGRRRVFGVDASSIPRPLSPTARDRTYVHASNLPEGSKPVIPGWQVSSFARKCTTRFRPRCSTEFRPECTTRRRNTSVSMIDHFCCEAHGPHSEEQNWSPFFFLKAGFVFPRVAHRIRLGIQIMDQQPQRLSCVLSDH